MERRNFFKLAPLGLLGMAATLSNGETQEAPLQYAPWPDDRLRIDPVTGDVGIGTPDMKFYTDGVERFRIKSK